MSDAVTGPRLLAIKGSVFDQDGVERALAAVEPGTIDNVLVNYEALVAEVTRRKAAESALQESEAQLGVILKEREQLERSFYQAQKMETVGRLAGGIAHDFNNILTAIVGFGTLIAEQVAGDEAAERNARELLLAAGRATSLTRQLLAFGRRQVLHPAVLDRKSTRLNSSHVSESRMPSSA